MLLWETVARAIALPTAGIVRPGLVGALGLLLWQSAASAAEGRIGRGGSGIVAQHYHIDPKGCRSGRLPETTVKQAPHLGRLAFRPQTIRVPSGGCVGKSVRATVVVYTAGRRAGRDEFSYDFRFPQASEPSKAKQVVINIR